MRTILAMDTAVVVTPRFLCVPTTVSSMAALRALRGSWGIDFVS